MDLLDVVQPSSGWFAVLGIKGKSTVQKLVETREELDHYAELFVAQQRHVYFGVAKFGTNANRTKDNVSTLKSFWMDIDCGPRKAEVNQNTGRPDGYIDQAAGVAALRKFCKLIGLPKPYLVSSGRGIHVYWPLTDTVTRQEWEPVAARLSSLCITHEFYVDPSVFEVSRVLRVPGTLNFKDTPPSLVEVISEAPPVDFALLRDLLGVKETHEVKVKRELSELAKALLGNSMSSFSKILTRSAEGTGCQQILYCCEHQEQVSEPLWWDALSVANFCEDRGEAIHKISSQHPEYDAAATEEKASHSVGPHTCESFAKHNPGGCNGCPNEGKVKSPIQLGRSVLKASTDDNEGVQDHSGVPHPIPTYPAPYFRGKHGGIYRAPADEEDDPKLVYEHDLYVVKRMHDPVEGDVVVMKLHTPRDGVKEFVITNAALMDSTEVRKVLAAHGVLCGKKQFEELVFFLMASIKELQFKRKAEKMRLQFGWADRDSKFICGDREVTKEGIFHSPPSTVTANIAQHLNPVGTLEKWKEVFDLYGRPGLEPHAFATLSAFGSPLLKFFGLNGAILNVIHPRSGTGKTTVLHMANSVVGDPQRLCAMWDDTLNAKFMRLGVMNNLCFTVDEMTNTSPADFSTLSYGMSQGRGKDRVKASANELRVNLSSWQCISLCSSNASFYEKLTSLKNSPDGEMMRLLEYKIDYSDAIDTALAKHMFDKQLKENYGHAGDIYFTWLVNNLEEARDTAFSIQAKIDRELKLTQRERFWSAVLAANITGGLIAKNLGLISWDMKSIYKWATTMVLGLREEVRPPIANDEVGVLGDYINRHMQSILVVNDEVDRRSNMQMLPTLEPRNELLIRYEPDTKRMFLVAKAFKDECVKMQVNYRETLKNLESKGIFLGTTNKRMAKGMKVVSPGVHTLIFDCSHTDFINIDGLVAAEAPNAGGEG